ncbi:MAG: helix-turn-helix transcriptional regulator [Oscillospiraceae bacterium]|nr:helix-turn-helix transcriptional regulator [Oscillospiraceae bacterium]
MNLGENIYRLRTEKNMSQGSLADALGVSRQSVSKWENNSATPELDKLIKMSELFSVTLDELAGLNQADKQSQTTIPDPKVIYIEKPVIPHISKLTIIGVALIFSLLLYAMLRNSGVFSMTWALILAVPVAICVLLFLFTNHAKFYCGWVGAAAYWLYFLILFHNNWEHQYTLLFLGVALVIAMIVWSVFVHKNGLIHIPFWVWLIGAIILTGAFILLWVNIVPPIGVSVTEHSVESAVPRGE